MVSPRHRAADCLRELSTMDGSRSLARRSGLDPTSEVCSTVVLVPGVVRRPGRKRVYARIVSRPILAFDFADVDADEPVPLAKGLFYLILDPLAAGRLAADEDDRDRRPLDLLINPFFDCRIAALLNRFPSSTVVVRVNEACPDQIAVPDLSHAPGVALEMKAKKDFSQGIPPGL